jgi:hypothetical protein
MMCPLAGSTCCELFVITLIYQLLHLLSSFSKAVKALLTTEVHHRIAYNFHVLREILLVA